MENTLPITFLDKAVIVEWPNGDKLEGKIGEYSIGEYIILLTPYANHLIPWSSIDTVWYQNEEQKAKPPPSRKTREKQKIAKSDFPNLPESGDLEREVAESETKPEAQKDVVNWDPANLEWETVESRSGKGPYERHPFTNQKVTHTPDYDNLREAILAVQKTGKHVLGHKESGYYYWLSEDKAVIMRRVSKW